MDVHLLSVMCINLVETKKYLNISYSGVIFFLSRITYRCEFLRASCKVSERLGKCLENLKSIDRLVFELRPCFFVLEKIDVFVGLG